MNVFALLLGIVAVSGEICLKKLVGEQWVTQGNCQSSSRILSEIIQNLDERAKPTSPPSSAEMTERTTTTPANPTVRLMNGSSKYTGRVEVFYHDEWGTVCDNNWGIDDANVVCRMLGFSNARLAPHRAIFGEGTGRIWLNNVHCFGGEASLYNCSKDSWGEHHCEHRRDASVVCTPSSVRLVNGTNSYSGRVEVKYNGRWGTICDNDWDIRDAEVICRMFGFATATSAPSSALFGQGNGKIWFDNVNCTGTEVSIWNCTKRHSISDECNHQKDASVVCQPIAVRLVNGVNSYSGRVEMNFLRAWWTFCGYNWNMNDAKVVCRMLGYSGAMFAPHSAFFGEGAGRIIIDGVNCNGTESSLMNCRSGLYLEGLSTCGHRQDASVVCAPPSVRLVNGPNSYSGRVEVKYNGTWGTICDDDWDMNDAKVICRMFGFANATFAPRGVNFGQGTGRIWFNHMSCTGTELSIWNCTRNLLISGECNHSKDVSVVCKPITVRLVNGDNSYSGRVEVNLLGEWGTVCDYKWNIHAAKVVCRMLGFPNAASAPRKARFGKGTGRVWLGRLTCKGTEKSIWDCSKDTRYNEKCSHYRDASVVCTP